jgi:periplasmic divalent cation tolerance protein
MASKIVQLVLNCGSWQEAQRIADSLLKQHLIAAADFIPVKSTYPWKGKIQDDQEIRLVMASAEHLFEKVEQEVEKLHSYEVFVLQSMPVLQTSHEAESWLQKELPS